MKEMKALFQMLLRPPSKSIGTKLFLIFFCFLSTSVAALGFFSSSIAGRTVIEQAQRSSVSSVSLAGEKLDMKLQFYLDVSNQLLSNSAFTKNLLQITSTGIHKDELQRRSAEIRGLLDQLALSDPSIRDLTLFPMEDALAPISTEREGAAEGAGKPWLEAVRKAGGEPVWLPVEEKGYLGSSPRPLFAYGRLIGRSNAGSHDFVLLVQVEAKVLQGMVQALKLSEGAETLITAGSGRVVLSSRAEAGGNASLTLPAGKASQAGYLLLKGDEGKERMAAYRTSSVSDWAFVGIADLDELTAPVRQIEAASIAFIAGNIGIALLIGLWIVRIVGKPLSALQQLMKQAADGNLTGRLEEKRQDEIGQVAVAYNRMTGSISLLVREARDAVLQVSASSQGMSEAASNTASSTREIHFAADHIAKGAVNLAIQSEQGTERMERMGERLTEALALQQNMACSAQEVHTVCREASGTVGVLLQKTSDTEASFSRMSERVHNLQESSRSIQQMLKLMTEMAKQTKILSLNASIEATRAGLAGAGFKVIANEIRQLAERSNASIGHVSQLTESIQGEVSSTVQAIGGALPYFQEMAQEVNRVHHLFAQIQGQMDGLLSRSQDVTESLRQLDKTQATLNQAMGEVSAVSQESSASTEQVASLCEAQLAIGEQLVSLSERMNQVSTILEQQMSRFLIQ